MRLISVLILSLTVATLAPGGQAGRTERPPSADTDVPPVVRAYLRDRMGFSNGHIQNIARGRAVARVLDTDHAEDVSILGAVRIAAPAEWLITRLRDITAFERGNAILEIANFSSPPRLGDLDGLTLDDGDLAALPNCRPGHCDVQLPAAAMSRFAGEVPWKAGDAEKQANLLARRWLFDWLEAYRAGGMQVLGQFDDHAPRNLADEFHHIVDARDFPVTVPGFIEAMTDFPQRSLDGVEHLFYWSKFDFGLRPTIRLNHVLLRVMPAQTDGLVAVAATKQIYASHYFTTALELRFIVDDPVRPGAGFYLLYMTKSRVPGLTGFLPSLVRRVVKGRARGAMERHLDYTKQIAEAGGA